MSASPQTATGPAPGANASGVDESAAEAARNKPIGTAEFRPSAIFSHDMVLQRGKPIVLFGTGTPGRPVATVLSTVDGSALIRRQSSRSITDSVSTIGSIAPDGTWMVTLPPLEAGGPYTLTISDRTSVTLKYFNVMVGEVWIASGQSNIEFELHNDRDADSAIAASDDPLLRFFNVPKFGVVDSELIAAENQSAWRPCSPDSCSTMSAIAYYFARKLRRDLGPDVPVGIVDCYIGGTSITSWMSEHMLTATEAGRGYLDRYHQQIDGKTDQQFHDETDSWQRTFNAWNEQIAAAQAAEPDITWDVLDARYGECPWPPPVTPFSQYHVTGAFNAMVRRLAPFSTRGVLWYQGEEDEQRYASYRELLGCMIGEWRALWSRRAGGDFSDSYNVGRIVADDAARGHGAEPIADTPTATVENEAELPFIIVQLPRWIDQKEYNSGIDRMFWPHIREAQADAARIIPDVYLAVTFDTGEFNNIHPTDKRPVGERIALQAEAHVYGLPVHADGPAFVSLASAGETADELQVRFDNADGLHFGPWSGSDDVGHLPAVHSSESGETEPLWTVNRCDAAASGFEIAGSDGIYHRADARIEADTVVLHADAVSHPICARYGWFSWGPAPLFNAFGLPAAPFRIHK